MLFVLEVGGWLLGESITRWLFVVGGSCCEVTPFIELTDGWLSSSVIIVF